MLFDYEPQETGQALVADETVAREYKLQLPSPGPDFDFRCGHRSSILPVFSDMQMYETPFRHISTWHSLSEKRIMCMHVAGKQEARRSNLAIGDRVSGA